MTETILIVGAGQTGAQAAMTLRDEGFVGRVVMVGDETHPPYNRPCLTGTMLRGNTDPAQLQVHPDGAYAQRDIELVIGSAVVALGVDAKRAQLAGGATIPYDRLLLATGSTPRRLDVPGHGLAGVKYLRTLDDGVAVRSALGPARRVVIVGGGWIGLQITAEARRLGCEVTLLEAAEYLLPRVAAPEVALIARTHHATRGVRIITDSRATGFEAGPDGQLSHVLTHDDRRLPADVAVLCVGATPNSQLAEAAGIEVRDGVVVDARCQTSHPAVFAAGDVTRHYCEPLQRWVRLESWRNSGLQAAVAARAMLDQPDARYDALPSLYSNQGELKIEVLGLPDRWDRVMLRGDMFTPDCTAFYLLQDKLVGVVAFNRPGDIPVCEGLIRDGVAIDARRLMYRAVPLTELGARTSAS